MLFTMTVAFTVFSLLLIPTIRGYKSGLGYEGHVHTGYATSMIANLGYSSMQCHSAPVSLGSIPITCEYGIVGQIVEYGINNPDMGSPVDACINNDFNRSCKPNTKHFSEMLNKAVGSSSKSIKFSQSDIYSTSPGKMCSDPTNTLFVQFKCIQSVEQQAQKFEIMNISVATATLICLLYVVVLKGLWKGGVLQQLEWDISTVTAGDYTVEVPISKEAYLQWKLNEYPRERDLGYAPALSFKRYLTEKIESTLRRERDRRVGANETVERKNTHNNKEISENVAIADIVFSYNNSKLIHALRDRGQSIALQKFDKMQRQEEYFHLFIKDFDAVTRPTAAFITFMEEDAKLMAMTLNPTRYDNLVGNQPMKFKQASEPTDIIWENRHFSETEYFIRQGLAFIVIGVLLFGSFSFIYTVARTSSEIAREFPKRNCDEIADTYGSQLQKYAVEDYDFVVHNDGLPSSGALQCFCKNQLANDYDKAMESSYGHP